MCSNDIIQIELQKHTDTLFNYFYERKRGEFNSLYPTVGAKKSKLGEEYKQKIIGNENAAQAFLGMYLDKPSQAKAERGRIFNKGDGFYDIIFDTSEKLLPEKLFFAWLMLKLIESEKKKFNQQYKKAEELPEEKQEKIYAYDFLLHSEYFILNLFKDFLKNRGLDIERNQENISQVISLVLKNDSLIEEIYMQIKELLKEFIDSIKSRPGYYHNKFFKSEKSIGLIRNFFNSKVSFIEILNL